MQETTTGTTTPTTSYDAIVSFYDMVGSTADDLRSFQYGRTLRGHMVETRELRKLFNKLNDLTAAMDTAIHTPDFTGTGPDTLKVITALSKVFKKFEAKFEVIGFSDDFPATTIKLRAVRLGLDDLAGSLRLLQGR